MLAAIATSSTQPVEEEEGTKRRDVRGKWLDGQSLLGGTGRALPAHWDKTARVPALTCQVGRGRAAEVGLVCGRGETGAGVTISKACCSATVFTQCSVVALLLLPHLLL